MMNQISLSPAASDADLVSLSIAGNRDAFGLIVARYQALVCSIGYSGTGSLTRSEDLAQETFFAAWKQLRDLREPAKLRAWLCGIARNLVNSANRRDGREPAVGADSIDLVEEAAAPEPLAPQQAISREEESILWRSLERIPESYREPMVLFYREHQSVERVAEAMDVSEDVVRQRLSRGRKLLHEEVVAFVEGALERSSPGKMFTIAVLAGLPGLALPASAATIGTTALGSGTLAKSAGVAGMLKLLAGPFTGIANTFLGHRIGMNTARTERERADVNRGMRILLIGVALFVASFALYPLAGNALEDHATAGVWFGLMGSAVFSIWLVRSVVQLLAEARQLRTEERARHPELFTDDDAGPNGCREYRSRWTLLGLPLVHVYFGIPSRGAPPACGWIAIGDRAIGVLVGIGQISFGFLSIGIVSTGVISIGVLGVGLLTVGTLAIGFTAIGTVAIGVQAFSGFCSLGWNTAISGTFAAAREYAAASHAFAPHANDAVARRFLAENYSSSNFEWVLGSLCALTVGVSSWYAWKTRKPVEAATPRTIASAASRPAPSQGATTRAFAIDYLRAFITVLVVIHHAVLAYHPYAPTPAASLAAGPRLWQAFPIVDARRWPGIDLLVGYNDTFFMALMFFISGLFVWKSLERKGASAFLRDRFLRLGLTFVAAATLLAPLTYYATYLASGATGGVSAFWSQWTALGNWPAGPAWFLWMLLAFACLAAGLSRIAPHWGDAVGRFAAFARERPAAFFAKLVLASSIVYLPVAWAFDPTAWFSCGPFFGQTSRVLNYALYFVTGVGVGAYGLERGLLASDGNLARRWGRWLTLSIVAFVCVVIAFIAYLTILSRGETNAALGILLNFLVVLTCAASSFAFLALFVRFAKRRRGILDSLSANAFGIFLLHYFFVIWLQFALRGVDLSGSAKGTLVIMGGLGLSWLATASLRRIPAIARIL